MGLNIKWFQKAICLNIRFFILYNMSVAAIHDNSLQTMRTRPNPNGLSGSAFRASCHKTNIIHFEALGPEAGHLEEETKAAIKRGEFPASHSYFLTPLTVQDFLRENPQTTLPELISIKTHSKIPPEYISSGNRKSIITRSAGYDHLEHLANAANIASLREYCVNAVAQTATKFMYACAGRLNEYSNRAQTLSRDAPAFMELGLHRILTVFGVGKIGKRICELAQANGLTVQGVDIMEEELLELCGAAINFVSKEEALMSSDIIVNAMSLTRAENSKFFNAGYFSRECLSRAKDGLIFINVTRGEIAPESVLLDLYSSGKLGGIGLDVFTDESEFAKIVKGEAKTENPDLLAAHKLVEMSLGKSANIYVQPHQGFNSDVASKAKAKEAIRHVVSFYKNNGQRFDEQLPYY